MKTMLRALVALPLLSAALTAADLSGAWTLNLDPDFGGERDSVNCTFTQDGVKLTIRCGAGAPGDGEVNAQKVTFHIPTGPRTKQ